MIIVRGPGDSFWAKAGGLLQFCQRDEFLAAAVGQDVVIAVRSGRVLHTLSTPRVADRGASDVWCTAVANDLDLVAAGHYDGRVSLWSLREGALLARHTILRQTVHATTLSSTLSGPVPPKRLWRRETQSPMGRIVAAASGDVAILRLDDATVEYVLPRLPSGFQTFDWLTQEVVPSLVGIEVAVPRLRPAVW